jgi:hypothetical protein
MAEKGHGWVKSILADNEVCFIRFKTSRGSRRPKDAYCKFELFPADKQPPTENDEVEFEYEPPDRQDHGPTVTKVISVIKAIKPSPEPQAVPAEPAPLPLKAKFAFSHTEANGYDAKNPDAQFKVWNVRVDIQFTHGNQPVPNLLVSLKRLSDNGEEEITYPAEQMKTTQEGKTFFVSVVVPGSMLMYYEAAATESTADGDKTHTFSDYYDPEHTAPPAPAGPTTAVVVAAPAQQDPPEPASKPAPDSLKTNIALYPDGEGFFRATVTAMHGDKQISGEHDFTFCCAAAETIVKDAEDNEKGKGCRPVALKTAPNGCCTFFFKFCEPNMEKQTSVNWQLPMGWEHSEPVANLTLKRQKPIRWRDRE